MDRRPDEVAALAPQAEAWRREAEAAFLGGYLETMEGCDACPRDAAERDALLRLFTLEKALYELRYELGNRPDWVGVPLGGLEAIGGSLAYAACRPKIAVARPWR